MRRHHQPGRNRGIGHLPSAAIGSLILAIGMLSCSGDGSGGGGDSKPSKKAKGQACVLDEDCEEGLVCYPDKCTDPPQDTSSSSGGSDAGSEDTYQPPPDEDFWVVYGRRLRQGLTPQPGEGENDLIVTARKNPGALTNSSTFGLGAHPWEENKPALELTKHSFKKSNQNCNHGCIISPNLKYIAVAVGPPGEKGYEYAPGILNDNLELFGSNKFGTIKDVADLHFAGDYLFYSTPRNCFDTGKCQYKIMRRDMTGVEKEKELTVMAPDSDPDVHSNPKHTTYTGRFQVSEDGSTLTFLTTTIRSVKVYAWRGGNVHKLDYICEHPLDNDTCVGTGSQYHDNDQVGISPDGTEVVLFTIVDRHLRVRRYQVKGEKAPTFSNIVTVPAGSPYLKSVCLNMKPWQHAEVRGRPVYSKNGAEIFFLGYSDCAGSSDKKYTDIMSIKASAIGGKLSEKDFKNYTANPRDNSPENLWIRDFSLSPEKNFFVFNAAPRFSSAGDPIAEGDKRQIKDTEVYTMPAQVKAEVTMITNAGKYASDAPVAVKPIKKPQ